MPFTAKKPPALQPLSLSINVSPGRLLISGEILHLRPYRISKKRKPSHDLWLLFIIIMKLLGIGGIFIIMKLTLIYKTYNYRSKIIDSSPYRRRYVIFFVLTFLNVAGTTEKIADRGLKAIGALCHVVKF